MANSLLTTGKAAKLCSVTPDALLKWIKSGRLRAVRTAGGHYRVRKEDLTPFLVPAQQNGSEIAPRPGNNPRINGRQFHYCWEYNGRGELLEGCRACAVFRMRAHRCYEVIKLVPEIEHNKVFCKASCQECEYFNQVHGQATNILVVTDCDNLTSSLRLDAERASFRLEITDCEYKCSALVESFKPDYVFIDCSLGDAASRDICNHLIQDPRLPYVRVIMASEDGKFPSGCDKEVFARIEKPFGIKDITECIAGIPEM